MVQKKERPPAKKGKKKINPKLAKLPPKVAAAITKKHEEKEKVMTAKKFILYPILR